MRKKSMKVLMSALVSIFLILMSGPFSFATQPEEIQTAIAARGARWISGETAVSRLSPEEKRMRLGLIKPTHAEGRLVLSTQESPPPTGVPASLDWRNHNGNFVTPVRDQGSCGSCWAFATTAALESALLRSGVPAAGLDKSEQVMVSCGTSGVYDAGSCDGGYINRASDFIKNTGLPAETCYPYTATDGTCSTACYNWQASVSRINSWSYLASTTVDGLKNGLNTFGPLVTTMDVYGDFFNYSSGIYSYVSGSYQGGHAILLVGYDDPGQYFIVKNSWGPYWGEAGYFRIAYTEVNSVVNFGDYTIAYSPAALSGDTAPPTVTNFVIPSTATSLTVSITTFTATDNTAVTGYLLTETSTAPSSSAAGWSASAPTTYTFTSAGTKTLYAWAKDAANNVSTSLNDTVAITVTTPPASALNIFWQHRTTGALSAWLMNGTNLASLATVTPGVVSDTSWKIVGIGDFNNDGKPDILWQHQTTGTLSAWLMNGTSLATLATVTPGGVSDTNWKIVGVGDFNGDSHPDILWQHQATGALSVWLMDGTSLTSLATVTPGVVSDTNWKIVGTGDFNNDGKPDILWQHQATGALSAWLMDGTSLASLATVTPGRVSDTNWKIVGVVTRAP